MTSIQPIHSRRLGAALTAVLLVTALAEFSCGRKGPLRLEPRPDPPAITNITVRQVGTAVELTWNFPTVLSDGATAFDSALIRWVRCFHANRPLPGKQFRRRAEALRKLPLAELERQGINYRLRIPFKPSELAGKRHFFSLMYTYRRQKSPLSSVREFVTGLPAAAVAGLTATQEGKVIRLDWQRPTLNLLEKPLDSLAGYILYRRILPPGEGGREPALQPLTPRPLLQERYEDTDTSREGRYEYRIAAVLTPQIESAVSDPVSVTMVDTYPPNSPSGVVVFRARDHLLINWSGVADKDLSHYRIYRREDDKEEFTLLVDRLTEPHYEDRSVSAGHVYAYQVTAVDAKGNESSPSPQVDEAF